MILKKIKNQCHDLISSSLNSAPHEFKFGMVYTLYSDRFNLIQVGFAENNKILENKILKSESILLDKKRGKEQDLDLLIKTLNELNISFTNELNFRYSNTLIRHLSTLGWPVGRSLYKQRKIKKQFSFA